MKQILIENQRLARQLDFLIEMDRLKSVLRRSPLADGSRVENSAEHSWHLALMASILSAYANESVDEAHVIRLLLVLRYVEQWPKPRDWRILLDMPQTPFLNEKIFLRTAPLHVGDLVFISILGISALIFCGWKIA